MQTFQLTFMFPTDGTSGRDQSNPHQFEAESIEQAKRVADSMIKERSLAHRTVNAAVLTRTEDHLMEVTRWVRNGGWMDV